MTKTDIKDNEIKRLKEMVTKLQQEKQQLENKLIQVITANNIVLKNMN